MPELIGVVWIGWHLIKLLCISIVTWSYVVAWIRAAAHPIRPPPDSVCMCLYKCVWGSLEARHHSSPLLYWAWRLNEGACGCGKMTSLHLDVFRWLQQLLARINKALYSKERMSQLKNFNVSIFESIFIYNLCYNCLFYTLSGDLSPIHLDRLCNADPHSH